MSRFPAFGQTRSGGGRTPSARPSMVAAVDIGSSKISCLIARAEPGDTIEVAGMSSQASAGVKAGAVVDLNETERAIRAAVEEAERMAGVAISTVTVSFSGGRLASRHLVGETGLSEREICDRDLRRALDAAMQSFEAPGRVIVHALPMSWSIDGHGGVPDPRGMFGDRLGVELHVVTAAGGPVRNLALCVERAHLNLRAFVATPYASGLAALAPEEINLGAMLIDMGAGTTSAAVFIDGALTHLDVIPVGGGHVSRDLAVGVSTPLTDAERIKCVEGSLLLEPDDDIAMIPCRQLGDEQRIAHAPRSQINAIIKPRIEETLETLRDRLDDAGVLKTSGSRVVLTGGAAQLAGVSGCVETILGKSVRIGQPLGAPGLPASLAGPGSSAVVGLIRHALQGPREVFAGPPRLTSPQRRPRVAAYERGSLAKAAVWLRENF